MEGVKIYGLCLERLRVQISNARGRIKDGLPRFAGSVLLESYNTGEVDDIIDILELYDVEERTFEAVREKLNDLAFTVSELTREKLSFNLTNEGHVGLYLLVSETAGEGVGADKTLSASLS